MSESLRTDPKIIQLFQKRTVSDESARHIGFIIDSIAQCKSKLTPLEFDELCLAYIDKVDYMSKIKNLKLRFSQLEHISSKTTASVFAVIFERRGEKFIAEEKKSDTSFYKYKNTEIL